MKLMTQPVAQVKAVRERAAKLVTREQQHKKPHYRRSS
jgi:hypothetical protein